MNITESKSVSIHSALQEASKLFQSIPSMDYPHILVVALFILVLHARTTYLPVSVPAFLLSAYREWSLRAEGGVSTIKYSLSSILVCWLGTFAYRLLKRRLLLHSMPGIPHNIILGHIITLAKESTKFPSDIHPHVLMNYLAEKYNLREKGLFYVDIYPIQNTPLLVIACPEVAAQVSQINVYQKHPALKDDFGAVLGYRGIVIQEGDEWKKTRMIFNPGFSQANLLTMVPMIVEETEVLASRLLKIASSDGFARSIEALTADVTSDIIGRAVFGVKFYQQITPNPIVHSIIQVSRLVGTVSDLSPERLNLWKMLKSKYHETVSNKLLMKMLRVRWAEFASSPEKAGRSNAIFDIAMATYMKKVGKVEPNVAKDFLQLMRDNVKTFIFAGHDTSSSVLAYSFYQLSRHPDILAEVRKEHETVLGADPQHAFQRLKSEPNLANSLPLTTAIIREVMRCYLPATSVRTGPPGATITGLDGKAYPTAGYQVWINNNITMHDPSIFPKPYEFIPNRFIPEKSPFPPIPKNAYRPFEKGPRDCIGQELAMLESRIVLALILRLFDFEEAYGELDRRLGRKGNEFEACEKIGGRAYQILWTTAKPKDGLPMWVRSRK